MEYERIWPLPGSGSWIQGSKKHRIPDPDPQHCFVICNTCFYDFLKKHCFPSCCSYQLWRWQLYLLHKYLPATYPLPALTEKKLTSWPLLRKFIVVTDALLISMTSVIHRECNLLLLVLLIATRACAWRYFLNMTRCFFHKFWHKKQSQYKCDHPCCCQGRAGHSGGAP